MNYNNKIILKTSGLTMYRGKTWERAKTAQRAEIKRGKINDFSRASARRLRKFLINYIGDGLAFGLTCTVPFCDLSIEDWYKLVERFRVNVTRCGCGLVYRVELQKNGMPHIHCVGYADNWHSVFDCQSAWWFALESIRIDDDKFGNISILDKRGTTLFSATISRPRANFYRWYAYLCGHASKSKKSQLGWQGRAWGVINKKYFRPVERVEYPVSDSEYFTLLRWVRRLTRARNRRGSFGETDWFCNPATIKRMLDFINVVLPF